MKNDLTGVKVGDKLWSSLYGWGKVSIVKQGNTFPISVTFDNTFSSHTIDGKKSNGHLYPSLFWDEIKFEYPKKPLPDLAVDTKLVVWTGSKKYKRYFKRFDNNGKCVCFYNGATSFSDEGYELSWDNYELYEEAN